MITLWRISTSLAVCAAFLGCGGTSNEYKPVKDIPVAPAHDDHHGHDHGHAAGPHKGSLVEIGEEEFHAEIVVDDKTHALRVYLLGPDAKSAVTTAAADLTMTLADGTALTLKPVEGSPEGQHSEFVLVDEKSVEAIHKEGFIHGTLVLKIGEKTFTPELDIHFDGGAHGDAKPADSAAPAK